MTIGEVTVDHVGTGGLAPLEFAINSGVLPRGLALDENTGLITGSPSDAPGEYRLRLHCKTALGDVSSDIRIILGAF